MNRMKLLRWMGMACILCSWIACSKSGNTSISSLNPVESQIAGTWKLVSKTDSLIMSGNILIVKIYSDFKNNPTVVFGTGFNTISPVAKEYTYKVVNIGPVFSGAPDSTVNGIGSWYYDMYYQSIYINMGRGGFSMNNKSLTVYITGDGNPIPSNTWIFTK